MHPSIKRWLGGVAAILGVALALLWASFATLFVPQCSSFSFSHPLAVCRQPMFVISGGAGVALVGAILLASSFQRR